MWRYSHNFTPCVKLCLQLHGMTHILPRAMHTVQMHHCGYFNTHIFGVTDIYIMMIFNRNVKRPLKSACCSDWSLDLSLTVFQSRPIHLSSLIPKFELYCIRSSNFRSQGCINLPVQNYFVYIILLFLITSSERNIYLKLQFCRGDEKNVVRFLAKYHGRIKKGSEHACLRFTLKAACGKNNEKNCFSPKITLSKKLCSKTP